MNLVFGKETFDCIWQAGKEREMVDMEGRDYWQVCAKAHRLGYDSGHTVGFYKGYNLATTKATDAEWDEAHEINRFIDSQRNSAECHDSQFDGDPLGGALFAPFGLVFVGVGCDCGCAQCETWGSRPEDV